MRRNRGSAEVFFSIAVFLILILILSSGCTNTFEPLPTLIQPTPASGTDVDRSWMDIPLTDLQGKGNFSIGSFTGRSVILPVVSDACPSCVRQLSWQIGEIERLDGVQDKSITVLVLDIDPPGDPGFIAKYHDNFTGYTARSSDDMTLHLLRDFGVFAVDTATNPVVLICPDGHAVLLPPGPKAADSIETFRTKEC